MLPQTAYNALQAAFTAMCPTVPLVGVCDLANGTTSLFDGGCFALDKSQLGMFPTVTTMLAGPVKLALTPDLYLQQQNGTYCLGLVAGPDTDGSIMGDVLMQGFTTLFDRVNTRVGFGPLTC